MEFPAALLHIIVDFCYLGVFLQLVLAAGHIYLDEVLVHDASGAEVHMPDFGVAHLSVRQSDVFSAGLQVAERISGAQAVNERLPLCVDCVAVVVTPFAPTVENHQKYFSVHYLVFFVFRVQIYNFVRFLQVLSV